MAAEAQSPVEAISHTEVFEQIGVWSNVVEFLTCDVRVIVGLESTTCTVGIKERDTTEESANASGVARLGATNSSCAQPHGS